MRVGARIKAERLRRRLNYRGAASELGVNASAVLRWENGVTLPHRDRLRDLADWCDVDFDVFVDEWRTDAADKRQGLSLAPAAPADLDTALAEVRDLRAALQAALERLDPGN